MSSQGFIIPELILESIIRDGLQNVRNDKTILDSIFAQLTRAYNDRKYGQAEIDKIKAFVDKEIPVLYSYHQVDAQPISITIVVGSDREAKENAHLDDYYESVEEQIVDADELEALQRVSNMNVTGFDEQLGRVFVADSVDLSPAYKGMIYVDSAGTEHILLPGISNVPGDKFFTINKLDEVDFSDQEGYIKSSLDYKEYDVRGVTSGVNLTLGVHSKDALTTKYLYILLKYFIVSRKKDIIKRGLIVATYDGSDFNRDQAYLGDSVFTRFLTISGKCDDTWRSDQVILIDNIEVDPTPIE